MPLRLAVGGVSQSLIENLTPHEISRVVPDVLRRRLVQPVVPA